MNKKINLKGVVGDPIVVIVNEENTNYCTIRFDDTSNSGLRSKDQLPELVDRQHWYYASKKDKELTEKLYNTEISDKRIWVNLE